MTPAVSHPNRVSQILWHGYCQLVKAGAPLEDQKRFLGIAEWTRCNGGTLPPWAQPASPPAFNPTVKLSRLEEGEDA